jgi:hypothetical protein
LQTKRSAPRVPAKPAAVADQTNVRLWLAGCAIVLLGALIYANSLSGSFVVDDPRVVENPDIRQVWSLDNCSPTGEFR